MKRIIAQTLMLLMPLSAFAERGGSVGGGGADTHTDSAAWFTDPDLSRTIHACIEVDPSFGVSAARVQTLTANAFQNWVEYYQKTGATVRESNANEWQGCSIDGGVGDRKGYRIATHLNIADTCDGTEDLTLYFGVSTPDLEARRKHYVFPYAFAELKDLIAPGEHQKAWSKGLIWIAPGYPWSNYDGAALEMTLTHEMGHVFGTGHIENTIMSENIGDQILKMVRLALPKSTWHEVNPLYLSIDKTAYLVLPPEQAFEVPLSPPAKSFDQNGQFQRSVVQNSFTALTGMKLQDDMFEAELVKPAGVPRETAMRDVWELGLFASTLTIRADGVESKLLFMPLSFVSAQTEDGIAFNEGCAKQKHMSGSIAGQLIRPSGVAKQVVFSFNTEGRIQVYDDPYNPSAFCNVYARLGVPCVLLSADYDKIADGLRSLP